MKSSLVLVKNQIMQNIKVMIRGITPFVLEEEKIDTEDSIDWESGNNHM